jgi:translation initiation factor 2 beta subunit (eIF-2beta)/eIF-5
MVAKRDEKIQDLEILVEGHRESIREYKHELEKLQADKELNKGIIHGQSEVIDDLRSQLETPINFDDD